MASEISSETLALIVTAGTAMAGAIVKLWTRVVALETEKAQLVASNQLLTERLHTEHKTDLREHHHELRETQEDLRRVLRFTLPRVELRDVPWAPSISPPLIAEGETPDTDPDELRPSPAPVRTRKKKGGPPGIS